MLSRITRPSVGVPLCIGTLLLVLAGLQWPDGSGPVPITRRDLESSRGSDQDFTTEYKSCNDGQGGGVNPCTAAGVRGPCKTCVPATYKDTTIIKGGGYNPGAIGQGDCGQVFNGICQSYINSTTNTRVYSCSVQAGGGGAVGVVCTKMPDAIPTQQPINPGG